MSNRASIFGTLSLFASVAAAPPAAAQTTPQECAAHFEEGQSRRASRDYTAAKTDFIACSQRECPDVIVRECLRLLSDIERDLPTDSFRVTDGQGGELFDVEVSMDGEVLTHKLEATTFAVNPGVHKFRFAAPEFKPTETNISVLDGEHGRVLEIALESTKPKPVVAPAPLATVDTTTRLPPQSHSSFHVPTFTWIAAGVGLVAIGSFAYFRLSGAKDFKELQDTCDHNCSESQIDPVRQKYVISTVSLAVSGAAFAAAGLTLWLGQSSSPAREGGGDLAVRVDPTGASLYGRF